MATAAKKQRFWLVSGLILLAMGLLLNPWLAAAVLSDDGRLATANVVVLILFDLWAIVVGMVLILGRREGLPYFTRAYRGAALLTFNTLLLLVALNIAIHGYLWLKSNAPGGDDPSAATHDGAEATGGAIGGTTGGATGGRRYFTDDGAPIDNGRRSRYMLAWFNARAYGDASEAFIGGVLDDFHAMAGQGRLYQPWVQTVDPPFAGKHLNIELDETGLPVRRTANPPRDSTTKVIWIYALGGSTTMGYYVADEHTWPSYLSQILNERAAAEGLDVQIHVRNYGRAAYIPAQETELMLDLLRLGHRPSLCVFLDGVNIGPDENVPYYTQRVEEAVARLQFGGGGGAGAFAWLPMVKLVQSMLPPPDDEDAGLLNEAHGASDEIDEPRVRRLVQRFTFAARSARAIGQGFDVPTLSFLQPNAVYNYNVDLYRDSVDGEILSRLKRARRLLTAVYDRRAEMQGLIDLSDLFAAWGQDRMAVVDDVHYNPAFSRFLAERIASHIDLRSLRATDSPIDPAAMTGAERTGVRKQMELIEGLRR